MIGSLQRLTTAGLGPTGTTLSMMKQLAQFSRSIEVIEKRMGEYALAVCTITMMDPVLTGFSFF